MVLPSSPTATFPYRVLGMVGEGAMGQVFRAEDIELGRQVAIKVVKPSFLAALSESDAQSAMQRFLQEARAAAALTHPGVTVVHRVGTAGGWPYIAMEWLDGRTFEEVLAQHKKISVDQAARVGLQLLAVLDAAHRAGIVHRDIKPANLVLTKDRRIKVTDFGVARVQGSNLAHTQAGLILGTPHYAAPEQLAGQAVDARTDLYAVGAVLYEAVTGRPPFNAESAYELIGLVQTTEPPPASALAPDVTPAFDTFLRRALAKRPDERFSTAVEMSHALQAFLTRRSASQSVPASTRASGVESTLAQVSTITVEGKSPTAIMAAAVRRWHATALGRQVVARLLDRVLEKPLHTAAFCGALEAAGAIFLICDGVLFDAFDPITGRTGDLVIDALPFESDATLFTCPPGTDARVVALLASLLVPATPRLSGLDAAFVDVPQLTSKLATEGFDGTLRLERGAQLGYVLFSRGRRVLDVFGSGWPEDPSATRWELWIASTGAVVSVEDRRSSFPSLTFRRQLREVQLEVVRAPHGSGQGIRVDSRAEAGALQLRPSSMALQETSSGSTIQALVDADPAVSVARWLLADVGYQFEQHQRTSRWRALLEPLASVETVRLHHAIPLGDGRVASFDAATFGGGGQTFHVIERVTAGTREAVASFISHVVAAKGAGGAARGLTGALLVAPSFSEDALEAYLSALRASRKDSLRSALELFRHREGFLTVAHDGCHILLVEEVDGRRRPLVPEN